MAVLSNSTRHAVELYIISKAAIEPAEPVEPAESVELAAPAKTELVASAFDM